VGLGVGVDFKVADLLGLLSSDEIAALSESVVAQVLAEG
jgi:hypothetical protein